MSYRVELRMMKRELTVRFIIWWRVLCIKGMRCYRRITD